MFKVIIDTREKYAWSFVEKDVETVTTKIDTGDYTIEGMEDLICIERKRSVSEWSLNLTSKRFFKELERMQTFKWKYIICEFTLGQMMRFPEGAKLPARVRNKIRVRGPFLLKKTTEIMRDYNVPILFCDNHMYGEEVCYDILKRGYQNENTTSGS